MYTCSYLNAAHFRFEQRHRCTSTHTQTNKLKDAYLLEHSSLVDFLSGDVTHLQDAQGKGFEGWLLDQVRVMDIQTGEHSLRQGVALQPCDLCVCDT